MVINRVLAVVLLPDHVLQKLQETKTLKSTLRDHIETDELKGFSPAVVAALKKFWARFTDIPRAAAPSGATVRSTSTMRASRQGTAL